MEGREEREVTVAMPSEAEMERRMKLGLTDAEWEHPEEAMFTGGLVKMWNCRNVIEAKFKRRKYDEFAEEEQYNKDKNQFGRKEAFKRFEQRMAEHVRQENVAERFMPLWRNVSGLYQDEAYVYGPMERARRIMTLINAAARLIRHELKFNEDRRRPKDANANSEIRNPKSEGNGEGQTTKSGAAQGTDEARSTETAARSTETRTAEQIAYEAEVEEEERQMCAVRTFLWDPLRTICAHLEIPQRRLSSFAKEVLGISAPELVDKIKAKSVRARMKEELKEFIIQNSKCKMDEASGTPLTPDSLRSSRPSPHGGEGNAAEEILAALQKSRRAPRFHRTTWAISYGFSSYQKFFRACLLCYGKTPHQLELELIEELLRERRDECRVTSDGDRGLAIDDCGLAKDAREEVVRRE